MASSPPIPLVRSLLALAVLSVTAPAWSLSVRIDAPASDVARADLGAAKLEDYGSFVYAQLEAADLARLDAARLPYFVDPLAGQVRAGTLNLDTASVRVAPGFFDAPADASGRALHLVQFHAPIRGEWLQALRTAGLELVQYYPHQTMLVWGRAAEVEAASLAEQVRWTGGFPTHARAEAGLSARNGRISAVDVLYFNDGDPQALAQQLALNGARILHLHSAQPDGRIWLARIELDATRVDAVAALPQVMHIGYQPPDAEYDDERANLIAAGEVNAGVLAPPGYGNILLDLGLDGTGIIWAVADGGADREHPDLAPALVGGFTAAGCTSVGSGSGDDIEGHGTHVAGAILGRGRGDVSGPALELDANGYLYGQGIAPKAGLFPLRFIGGGCSSADPDRVRVAVLGGAVGSNNSWNNSQSLPNTTYTASARTHDILVRDGNFDTPVLDQFSIIFSSGNSGPNPATLTGPHAAKNIISVGATDAGRTGGNINAVSSFSSRGPAQDGRILPTLVATGGGTASTRIVQGSPTNCGTAIAGTNNMYSSCSGTSMSTPVVSGVATLVHEWWGKRFGGQPSPAMVKAMLINGARDLPGAAASNSGLLPIPNNDEGWGIVNIKTTLAPSVVGVYKDQATVLSTVGSTYELTVGAADTGKPLKVTIVWTDAPGAALANPALVNNLDLEVVNGGNTYRGNVFNNGVSATGGNFDTLANEENVFIANPAAGATTIRVRATSLNGDALAGNGAAVSNRQDFALVCTNCEEPGFRLQPANEIQVCAPANGTLPFQLQSVQGFTGPVNLSITGAPAGTNASVQASGNPPATLAATLTNTAAATPGRYTLNLTASTASQSSTQPLKVGIWSATPATPALVGPPDGATGIQSNVTMSWTAVAQAQRYQLELSTTPGFENPQIGFSDTPSITQPLAPGQWYWRVTAINGCGNGAVSPVRTFTVAAPVCSAVSTPIPDNSVAGVTLSQSLGGSALITDVDVTVEATHPRVGDLRYVLRHVPSGRTARLFTRPNLCTTANVNATFDDRATTAVHCRVVGAPPATIGGTLLPQDPLSVFNGVGVNGPWELVVADEVAGQTGDNVRWCLAVGVDADTLLVDGFE